MEYIRYKLETLQSVPLANLLHPPGSGVPVLYEVQRSYYCNDYTHSVLAKGVRLFSCGGVFDFEYIQPVSMSPCDGTCGKNIVQFGKKYKGSPAPLLLQTIA